MNENEMNSQVSQNKQLLKNHGYCHPVNMTWFVFPHLPPTNNNSPLVRVMKDVKQNANKSLKIKKISRTRIIPSDERRRRPANMA